MVRLLAVLLLITALPGLALANRTGVIGHSGKTAGTTCVECHTATRGLESQLAGAIRLEPGKKGTYYFTMAASSRVAGGLNIAASGGTLSVSSAEPKTKLVDGEITHSEPKGATQSSLQWVYRWTFDWTAPTTPGTYTIYAAGIDGNGNSANTGDYPAVTAGVVEVGACRGDYDCNDSDICTNDTCDESHVCQHTRRADCCATSADCVDTDPCTTDTCNALNNCEHRAKSGCCRIDDDCDKIDSDPSPCHKSICDRTNNTCMMNQKIAGCCSEVAPGLQCDDGSRCTTDTCDMTQSDPPDVPGMCKFTPVNGCCMTDNDCRDNNPCTTESCNSIGLTCSYTQVSACCTSSLQCDDGNRCTQDYCTTNKCEHKAIAGCLTDGGVAAGDGPGRDGSTIWTDGGYSQLDGGGTSQLDGSAVWPDFSVLPGGDKGSSSGSDDGCCRVSHARELSPGLPLLLLGLGLLAAWQRRRSR